MKHMWIIIKKELIRVFKDPKLFVMIILFPGLLIYGMYSLMGSAFENIFTPDDSKIYQVYYVNDMPTVIGKQGAIEVSFNDFIEEDSLGIKIELTQIQPDDLETYKQKIHDEEIDYLVEFDPNFDTNFGTAYTPFIRAYYNPSNDDSAIINDAMESAINSYVDALNFKVHGGSVATTAINPLFEEDKLIGKSMSMFLPFLIISFLFSGIMSVAPESIAGEKERGTMATLLATPVNRTYIALGKIVSLSIISILSALSSFLGVVLSLPKMLQFSGVDINVSIYQFGDYVAVFLVLLSVCLLLVGLLSIASAYAKNIKEASIIMTPIMILSMAVGMLSMFSQTAPTNTIFYFIPLYNSILMLQQVFNFSINYAQLTITLLSDLVYAGIFVVLLTRMFNSERIMFSK